MAHKGVLADAERIGFCAGGKAQSHQRQSESQTPGGASPQSAVVRISICREHPPAPRRRSLDKPQTRRMAGKGNKKRSYALASPISEDGSPTVDRRCQQWPRQRR